MADEPNVSGEETATPAADAAAPPPAAPDAAPKEAAATALAAGPGEAAELVVEGGDWRDTLAGKAPEADREAARKILARVADEGGVIKKLIEQERLIRSGKHKAPLAADASEEEVAEYRKTAGIPERPDGYLEKLDGLVIGDADKEMVGKYLESAHAANMDPRAVKATLDWYYKTIEDQQAAQADADATFRAQAVEQMREAMGPDYRRNMADLKAWLSSREGLFDVLNGARLADGTLFGDNPAVVGFFIEQMRETNPLSTVVGAGSGSAEGLADEITKYQKMMRDDPAEYWKPASQERYRQLLQAKEKVDARVLPVSSEHGRRKPAAQAGGLL